MWEGIRQIRDLLYHQGYTIGGARLQLSGDTAREDSAQTQQVVKQLRQELEDVLKILKA